MGWYKVKCNSAQILCIFERSKVLHAEQCGVEWRCVGSAEFEHISKNVSGEDTGKDTCMLVHSRQGTCGGHRYSIWGIV